MISRHLVSYVLKAAFQDRLILSYILLLVVAFSLAVLVGSSAITEKDQFALVFFAASLRLMTIFILMLFSVFFIRRSFESRDIEFLLTRPVGRTQLLLSYALALSLLAIGVCILMGLCVILFSGLYTEPAIYLWVTSIAVEAVIIANAALFFAFVMKGAVNALLSLAGFYVLGRMIGQILGIVQTGGLSKSFAPLEFVMQVISIVTPRFDLMGQTTWLLYHDGVTGIGFSLAHGIIFTALLLSAALYDFRKREF